MSIRNTISKHLQNKQLKKHQRIVEYKDFSKIKSFGIIVSPEYTKQHLYLKEKLKASAIKDITDITINPKLKIENLQSIEDRTYNKACFNYWRLPKHPDVKEFTLKKFDILLDLSADNPFTEVVHRLSLAKIKVGNKKNTGKEYDFIISHENTDNHFIDLVIHYLQEIKS